MARIIISIILTLVVMAVHRDCLALVSSTRGPAVLTPSYSLTPTVGMFLFDGHSKLEAGPTYGVRLGYDMMGINAVDSLGIEAGIDAANTKSKTDNSSANAYLLRAEAFYSRLPRARFVPSLVIGAGGMFVSGDKTSSQKAFIDYGVSARYFLKDYLALRADFRHIFAYQDVALRSNFESTIGLLFYVSYDKSLNRVPPVDSDGNGVPDYLNKCLGTPKGLRVDRDGCPIDGDGDGVPDYLDKCLGTPKGLHVDKDGCPPKTTLPGESETTPKQPVVVPSGSSDTGTPAKSAEQPGASATKETTQPVPPAKESAGAAKGTEPPGASAAKETQPVPPVKEPVVVETPNVGATPAKKVPLLDSDGDGVPDYLDKCPGTPKGVAVDKDGCPTTPLQPERVEYEPIAPAPEPVVAVAPVKAPAKVVTERKGGSAAGYFTTVMDKCPPLPQNKIAYNDKPLKRLVIYFKTDSADIGQTFNKRIFEISDFMKRNPSVFAFVEGHADYLGPFEYNMTLSRVRAINIKNQIIRNGEVDPARISIGAYGCSVPIGDNRTVDGRKNNRRGVTVITLTESTPAIAK